MADEDGQPAWVAWIRQDLAAFRLEFQTAVRELVTREAFNDERQRTDKRFADQGKEIAANEAAIAAEAQARSTERQDALQAQLAVKAEQDKQRRATTLQWLALAVSLVVGPIVGALIAGAMAVGGP